MTKLENAWIVGDSPESCASLTALANTLAENLTVVESNADIDSAVAALIAKAKEATPQIIIFNTTRRTRLAAAMLAAAFETSVLNDSTELTVNEEGKVISKRLVHGGSAICTECVDEGVAVVLASDELLATQEAVEAEPVSITLEAVANAAIEVVEKKEKQTEAVNLATARRVVSIGRGIGAEEDLAMIEKLAQVMEAEIGCTRPISEGNGWLARERYIGVSGAIVKPNVFVAIGLSGQIQHMVGARNAGTIVAINKDKNAPIFKFVDYGIVGDLYEVVPKLIEVLEQ